MPHAIKKNNQKENMTNKKPNLQIYIKKKKFKIKKIKSFLKKNKI